MGVAPEGGGIEDREEVLGLHALDVFERAAEVCVPRQRPLQGTFAHFQLGADHQSAQPVMHQPEELDLLVPREPRGLRVRVRVGVRARLRVWAARRPTLVFTIEPKAQQDRHLSLEGGRPHGNVVTGGNGFPRIRPEMAIESVRGRARPCSSGPERLDKTTTNGPNTPP
jgi:hypothetical protein